MLSKGKHPGRTFDIQIPPPIGGINVSVPIHAVPMEQCVEAWNIWISPNGEIATRPGTSSLLTTPLPGPITGLHFSAPLGAYLVASAGKLYKLDTAAKTATLLGDLAGNATNKVSFADFKSKCYVASGGVLQCYDGASFASVTSLTANPAPQKALYVVAQDARLWTGELESRLSYSGTYDPQDWGGAAENSGGFLYIEDGDGAEITGLSLIEGVPIIFKGNGDRGPYTVARIDGTTPENFMTKTLTKGVSCINGHTIQPYLNDLLFVGQDGVFSYQLLRDYVNPRPFPISLRVAPLFAAYTPHDATFDPKRGIYILAMSGAVLVWHAGTESWWKLAFPFNVVATSIGGSGEILFGSDVGQVYSMGSEIAGNWLDDGEMYTSGFSTPAIHHNMPSVEKLFKWLYVAVSPLGPGSFTISWRKDYGQISVASYGETLPDYLMVGWDGAFEWDNPNIGWDQMTSVSRRRRLETRARDIQIRFNSMAPFKFLNASCSGALMGYMKDRWR